MREGRKNSYTFIASIEGDAVKPKHYEMIGYNSLLGSHYDRYYVTYSNFMTPINGTIPISYFDDVIKGGYLLLYYLCMIFDIYDCVKFSTLQNYIFNSMVLLSQGWQDPFYIALVFLAL